MSVISIPAHFDGERALLDAPVELERDARLLVTVLPKQDDEREDWLQLSMRALEEAYGDSEPDYGPESIREADPEYASR